MEQSVSLDVGDFTGQFENGRPHGNGMLRYVLSDKNPQLQCIWCAMGPKMNYVCKKVGREGHLNSN